MLAMKAQVSTGGRRSVATCAVHGQKSHARQGAAIVLGAAVQLAVLNHGVAEAFSLSVAGPPEFDNQAAKVENVVELTAKDVADAQPQVATQGGQLLPDFPGAERMKQATDGGFVASAQAGIDEAQKRLSQETIKAKEVGEAIGQAKTDAEKKAAELGEKAAQAKAAAEKATADKAAAVKDAAGKIGSAKDAAQKKVEETTATENDALKAASDAKVAAEGAIAEVVASPNQGMPGILDSSKP